LKGGDPFVFGRGGEEARALAEAGVAFEVVPGVTAGVAAPAYAGIPVTDRDQASAVAFVTGHEDPEKPESALDWEALARFPGTLVLYMGVRNLASIAGRLTQAGRDPDQPAAVVARGTLPGQQAVLGTLGDIADRAEQAGVEPPAVTVVGSVAGLGATLAWLERRPLHGQVVAVTRARAQAGELGARLAALGAEVIEAPAIRIEPRQVSLDGIEEYELVCLTSPNGVRLLFEALTRDGRDARALAGAKVAAIGPGTAAELERHGIRPDVVPERSVAEALVDALRDVPVEGRRALVARASEARDVLPEALRDRGAEVEVVALYDTVAEPLDEKAREGLERATYVTFTSSSTVRYFLEAGGEVPADARVASIGPVTTGTAREHGLEVHVEAERHDIDGLVEAILRDAAR
jgi:uroporphyrinogen III methyltransferase/synthase